VAQRRAAFIVDVRFGGRIKQAVVRPEHLRRASEETMDESYVSLAELKVILEKEKAVRGELNPEQHYSLSHAALFARVPADKVPGIVKELMEIPMMSPFNAMK